MERVLYKWTNYLSGWQPRWFVLVGGTLSYYDSQEDAWKGCKGSIKMSVTFLSFAVHSSDNTRMDLIIPGEQYFYLKAINAAERQKWLVALGTSKACLNDNGTKKEIELHENTEALKTKMSELRLYCDLLLQQVHKIKESSPPAVSHENTETGTLVKSTCGTFLKTLEECMQIASKTFNSELLLQTPPSSPPVAAIKPDKVKYCNPSSHSITESSGTRWYAAASRRKSCCPPKSERGGGTALHSELPPPGGGGAAGVPHAVVSNGRNMSCATASVATTGVPSASATAGVPGADVSITAASATAMSGVPNVATRVPSATAGVPRADVGITAASATATSRAPSTVATNGVLSAAAGVPNATALPERPQPKRGEPKHPAPERGEAEHPAPERGEAEHPAPERGGG
ncbi:pleckstrin homology domain-containing family A member 8-like [Huso huso]|uniref:Pleckstrin homology domain-containing family A member 8-like n=1 Tax=Huso huso TaxID=61971 RepID=A0ABR1A2S6_HUSHU